jgi:hypothetical protein
MRTRGKVLQVKELHKESIMAKPNVVGVGTGYRTSGRDVEEDLCVVAMVSQKIPRAGLDQESLIPGEIDGIRTDVIQVGVLRAHLSRTDRFRPVVGGVSAGHYKVTAGTLACVVKDRVSGDRLLLSNNHVFANSNQAAPGDAILQPGAADGGRVEGDSIASLERFYPIRFYSGPANCGWAETFARFGNFIAMLLGSKHRVRAYWSDPAATNLIDAAIARPLDSAGVEEEILDIGIVGGTTAPQLGMSVRKSGRSTGFTTGKVVVMDATVNVYYGDRLARFEDQLVTTPMSKPGDSGSLLVAGNALMAVGLLFAGSDQATIYNPIRHVLDGLGIVL